MTPRKANPERPLGPRQQRKRQALRLAQKLKLNTLARRILILLATSGQQQSIASLVTECQSSKCRVRPAIDQLKQLRLISPVGPHYLQALPLEEVEQRLQAEEREWKRSTKTQPCEECGQPLSGRLRFCQTCLPLDPAEPHELILPADGAERVEQIALRVRLVSERYARGLPLHPQQLTPEQRQQFAACSGAAEDRSGIPKKGNSDEDD